MKKATADYSAILHIGINSVCDVMALRPSGMLDFGFHSVQWRGFEKAAAYHGYDILKAHRAGRDAYVMGRSLRLSLMWLSAIALREDVNPLHPDDSIMSETLALIAREDRDTLEEKGRTYGDSWKKRGGVGAFMMLARKWDRIENILQEFSGAQMARQIRANPGQVQDDIGDLRCYLLLIADETQRNPAV